MKTEEINTTFTSGLILRLDNIRRESNTKQFGNFVSIFLFPFKEMTLTLRENQHVRLEDFFNCPTIPYVCVSSVVRPVAPSMFYFSAIS